MTNTAVIRERRESDVPDLAASLVAVYAADGYPVEGIANPEAWLNIHGALGTWVAVENGRAVGHLALAGASPDDKCAEIICREVGVSTDRVAVLKRMFVHPNSRRSGLGNLLLETGTNSPKSTGLILGLDVMLKDAGAIALYERHGWHRIGRHLHASDNGDIPAASYVLVNASHATIPFLESRAGGK